MSCGRCTARTCGKGCSPPPADSHQTDATESQPAQEELTTGKGGKAETTGRTTIKQTTRDARRADEDTEKTSPLPVTRGIKRPPPPCYQVAKSGGGLFSGGRMRELNAHQNGYLPSLAPRMMPSMAYCSFAEPFFRLTSAPVSQKNGAQPWFSASRVTTSL